MNLSEVEFQVHMNKMHWYHTYNGRYYSVRIGSIEYRRALVIIVVKYGLVFNKDKCIQIIYNQNRTA